MQKAEEDDSLDDYGGFQEANTGHKSASYYFVESVLTEIATRGSMDDMLEHNLELWTQLYLFMDAFTRRALHSSRFVRPTAKCVRKDVRVQLESTEQKEK